MSRSNPNARWFDDRPSRVQRCTRCEGTGHIDDGYALAPADYVLDAPNNAIRAFVVGSSDIFEACREAADIARKAKVPVAFEFIDHTVVVQPENDPIAIARQWWQKQYGETPEQTRAKR